MNPQLFSFMLNALPDGRMFDLDLQTVFSALIVLFNVALLAFILSKLLYKPVRKFLKDRADRIEAQFKQVEDEKNKTNALKSEYEQAIKNVDKERGEILDAARKLAEDNTRSQMATAKSEAEAVKTRAMKEIEMERERAGEEMKRTVIEISAAIAQKFLSREIDAEIHERLFAETMAELEELAWHS